jgi:hypothetical protein
MVILQNPRGAQEVGWGGAGGHRPLALPIISVVILPLQVELAAPSPELYSLHCPDRTWSLLAPSQGAKVRKSGPNKWLCGAEQVSSLSKCCKAWFPAGFLLPPFPVSCIEL